MSQPIASTSSEGCSAPKRHCGDNNKPTRPLPMNLWNLAKMIDTDEKAIVFSQSYGLLPYYSWCPTCHARLFPYQKKASRRKDAFYYRFQCQKYPCRKARTPNEVGLKKGTWFERSKVSMQKSLVLVYCFAAKFSHDETIRQSSLEAITSPETVVDFFNYCREVCVEALFGDTAEQPIGGPNYNVEIGEAKISKKKFNRGCLVEGQWVLGGICRETKDCFLVPVEDRTETILIDLIKQHVSVGTVIHTNCFSSSDRLKEEGYRHLTVNNSENLVDPEIGASTNLIESTLWSVRKELPIGWTPKRSFIGHLAEFIWRRRNRGQDAFLALLRDIGKVFPGPGPGE